jgi:hypothetical protein
MTTITTTIERMPADIPEVQDKQRGRRKTGLSLFAEVRYFPV